MIVRCIRLLSSTGEVLEKSQFVTIGSQYTVLEVIADDRGVSFRIEDDDNSDPVLISSESFAIVSSALPAEWVADLSPHGTLTLSPRAWREPGFWERLFDADADACAVYRDIRDRIVSRGD